MGKSGIILSLGLLLLLSVPGILVWRIASYISDLSAPLPVTQTGTRADAGENTAGPGQHADLDASSRMPISTDSAEHGHYESIEEIIARIKRDVIVTGTFTGRHGAESALFRIEGMPDRSFDIHTQLMDGFIITRIDRNQVILKNQSGDESLSLPVESGNTGR